MIRGWCPGALRPMESGDGLIVRLKICGGIVSTGLAMRIADWSQRWGNGLIDLSGRANLQMRGLRAACLPALYDAMAAWNLLDGSADGEAVRNVICSPLAGLDGRAVLDIRPVARALERRLSGDAALHALPGKFGFAIDDGGRFGLDDVAADVRFVARRGPAGPEFVVTIGGRSLFGPWSPAAVTDVAVAIAHVFIAARLGGEARVRRMRDLVAADGGDAIAQRAGLAPTGSLSESLPGRRIAPSVLGMHRLGAGAAFGVGLPFGRIEATALQQLAAAASDGGASEIRLTPWRAILVPVPSIAAAAVLRDAVASGGLMLDPDDPRRLVAACPGAPACARATTRVRDDAAVLAAELRGVAGSGVLLHMSGCDKGCAHPGSAPLTLVARDGRYDLVADGAASGKAVLAQLTLDQARRLMMERVAT
jgi:precorrin-3B synthase